MAQQLYPCVVSTALGCVKQSCLKKKSATLSATHLHLFSWMGYIKATAYIKDKPNFLSWF